MTNQAFNIKILRYTPNIYKTLKIWHTKYNFCGSYKIKSSVHKTHVLHHHIIFTIEHGPLFISVFLTPVCTSNAYVIEEFWIKSLYVCIRQVFAKITLGLFYNLCSDQPPLILLSEFLLKQVTRRMHTLYSCFTWFIATLFVIFYLLGICINYNDTINGS